MDPCIVFDNSTGQFQVLTAHSKRLSLLPQQTTLVNFGIPLKCEEYVNDIPFHRFANTHNALRYVRSFIFDHIHSLVANYHLYSEGKELSSLLQYVAGAD